ncbi:MAG: CBASS cGAMP-activated phospholipase [Candidatus Thiodiazotropha sp.]
MEGENSLGTPVSPFTDRNQQVITLSGGGYRGLFTARVLAALEESTGKPLYKTTNLFVGTSIGGILACGLACKIPAKTLLSELIQRGPRIFPYKCASNIQRFFGALYESSILEEEVRKVFGKWADRPLIEVPTPVVLTAVDEATARTFYLHNVGLGLTKGPTVIEALMATSAAPTYFGTQLYQDKILVDGGIGANTPEAIAIELLASYRKNLDRVTILSIGTAGGCETPPRIKPHNSGIYSWLKKRELINLMFSAQEGISTKLAETLLGDRYLRIDQAPTVKIELDDASKETRELLVSLAEQAILVAGESLVWRLWKHHQKTSGREVN